MSRVRDFYPIKKNTLPLNYILPHIIHILTKEIFFP